MKISFKHRGDFSKTEKYLKKLQDSKEFMLLAKYGQRGVVALSAATPVDTGKTAASWSYDVVKENGRIKLVFNNNNIQNGVNIAIILDLGHGTRNGGYVVGRDYINPAIAPVLQQLADELWKEVTN